MPFEDLAKTETWSSELHFNLTIKAHFPLLESNKVVASFEKRT